MLNKHFLYISDCCIWCWFMTTPESAIFMWFNTTMAANEDCLFNPCTGKGALQTLKFVAVQKIIATSKAKRDELHKSITSEEIVAHKSCYCSYTSKSRNNESQKRKSLQVEPGTSNRLLKSQKKSDFIFKRDCILCGCECKPKDKKNPGRWVPVKQCRTVDRGSNITFKQQSENICDERQDQWSNEVMVRLCGIIDLHAADAQYHVPCYNRFCAIPVKPITMEPDEEALRSVITVMTDNMTETWTTSEFYLQYTAASGVLSKRQFISTVTNFLVEIWSSFT